MNSVKALEEATKLVSLLIQSGWKANTPGGRDVAVEIGDAIDYLALKLQELSNR